MPRIQPLEPENAAPAAREILENTKKKIGMVPNLYKEMANSPAVLQSYMALQQTMGGSSLGAPLRERIALALAEKNGCDYCLAAHSATGRRVGLDEDALLESRRGEASDPKLDAAVKFALAIVEKQGWVEDDDLARVRDAGFSEEQVVDIFGVVMQNVFTNYFNHIAHTVVDFPKVKPLEELVGD